MKQWIGWLFTVPHTDVNVQRRGRTAMIVVAGLVTAVLPFIVLALFGDTNSQTSLPITFATLGCLVAAGAIIRSGRITLGVLLLLVIITGAADASMLRRQAVATTPYYMIVPLLVASVTMASGHIWPVMAGLYMQLAVLIGMLPESGKSSPTDRANIASGVVLIGVAAFTSYLGARSAEKAVQAAVQAQREASLAARATEMANIRLEQRVAERTSELKATLAMQQEQASALAESLERQQQLNEVVTALSVPIIPIQRDVLIVPLVGNIEAERVQQLLANVLDAIEQHGARTIFLDVTGVTTVDSVVAEALLQTAAAARLLGCEPVLVGVRPEVAQALGGLGADLSRLRSAASLETGLSWTGGRAIKPAALRSA